MRHLLDVLNDVWVCINYTERNCTKIAQRESLAIFLIRTKFASSSTGTTLVLESAVPVSYFRYFYVLSYRYLFVSTFTRTLTGTFTVPVTIGFTPRFTPSTTVIYVVILSCEYYMSVHVVFTWEFTWEFPCEFTCTKLVSVANLVALSLVRVLNHIMMI